MVKNFSGSCVGDGAGVKPPTLIFAVDFLNFLRPGLPPNVILGGMENKLNISAVKDAAAAFYNALAFANKVEAKSPEERDFYELESARASLIQHFEICYELCWKTMLRFIKMDIGGEADILTRKDIFRVSAEKRLIADFDRWLEFHGARNMTTHVYGLNIAKDVYQSAKMFAADLREFVETMEKRI